MSEDYAAVVIVIGRKGHLDDRTLHKMANAPALVQLRQPGVPMVLGVDGYDEDARSLWDIPECAAYIRRYAKASGLHDWRGPLFEALDKTAKALLIACDAIDKPHPFRLEIKADA